MASSPTCTVCKSTASLRRCARCSTIYYCSPTCQREDWPSHKSSCNKRPRLWYDAYRSCEDGNKHEGRLELITWLTPGKDAGGLEEDMGWGNILAEESDELKRKFEEEFGGDEERLYEYWPRAFRWTCCEVGLKMGKPMPENIYRKKLRSAAGKGLDLAWGPDPRSFNPTKGRLAESMRGFYGLDED